jgi:hypothetical protein
MDISQNAQIIFFLYLRQHIQSSCHSGPAERTDARPVGFVKRRFEYNIYAQLTIQPNDFARYFIE